MNEKTKRSRVPAAAGLLALAGLTLAGCSSAKVTNAVATSAGGPPPVEILVAVDATVPATDGDAATAGTVAARLGADLIRQLTEAHVVAEPFRPGTGHPGAALLHVTIAKADPGNRLERFVVGFGAGKTELQATATLAGTDMADAPTLASFDTADDSGHMPGLILPGGVALATHDLVHLAIGAGVKTALSLNDGLDKPVKNTSEAVVKQLHQYYATAGWVWPADRA